MMGYYNWNWGGNMMGNVGLLGLLTWIALLAFLITGTLYFWKQINRKK